MSVCVHVLYLCLFSFQNLETLTFYPLTPSHAALEKFCAAMPHITNLSLRSGHDGVLRAIAGNMHHLKSLNIFRWKVTPKAIEHLLPTEDNTLGGCPELVDLNLRGIKSVGVDLLKKIIVTLPRLRYLGHKLLLGALENLTEEEMGLETARHLNIDFTINCSYSMCHDILVKSPIFRRLNNNITTANILVKIPAKGEGRKESTLLGYEPADLTVHPPPKRSRVGSFFSHRCLVPPKFFPQRKSGFCRRYSH